MSSGTITLITVAITTIAAAASAVAAFLAWKISKHQLLKTGAEGVIDRLLSIHTLFRTYPCLCPYFYREADVKYKDDLEQEDKDLYYRVLSASSHILTIFAVLIMYYRDAINLGRPEGDVAWVQHTIRRFFRSSPVLCDHLLNTIREYTLTGNLMLDYLEEELREVIATEGGKPGEEKWRKLEARIAEARALNAQVRGIV